MSPRTAERGAVVTIVLLVLVALLTITAIVVDLAGLRLDRREGRAAADFAALAAGETLYAGDGGGAVAACERAWATAQANLGVAVTPAPGCATFAATCMPSSPRQVVLSAGGLEVTVTHPVPDGHPLMTGTGGTVQPIVADIDGASCDRMAVQVVQDRGYFFGRIVGIEAGSTRVHAVGRGLPKPNRGEPVALLLLEHIRCNALTVQGNGFIEVDQSLPLDGVRSPGHIAVDSDGSGCSSGGFTLDAMGKQQPAPGPRQ
jgi:hypothetical protein